jgi:TonB-dependent SusC/RagA subfamily outer membrane receptor
MVVTGNFKTFICVLVTICISCFSLNAQEITVVGNVSVFKVFGINKASIIVGSSGYETFSDSMGYYSVSCQPYDKLTFSAKGFFSEKVNLKDFNGTDSVNVDLKLKKGKKNISYATGYGHIDEKRLTYAIEHFDEQPDYSAYRSILEIIEGRVSGVTIKSNGILIRGGASTLNADTDALLIVDGTVVSFDVFRNIPPVQVKSIDILKGAAASARYGSRGMGGVVIVETKTKN